MLDIISIGDVTTDVFMQVNDLELKCDDKKKCYICMRYSDKIISERVDQLIGGNAGNVAIGSRRLGLRSALYAQVGNDGQGKLLLDSLKKDNVSTKYFTLAKGEKTNYSVIIRYGAERTILVHHEKRSYKLKKFEKSKWVYVTSMGDGSKKFLPFVLKNKKSAKLGFNPGSHQLKYGLKVIGKFIKNCEVLSLNVEEVQFLFKEKSRDIKKLIKKAQDAGPKIMLMTDGPAGSYVYDGKEFYYCPIYDVPILERTGCGDGYTTAFINALCNGKDIKEAMLWGTINAASVISKIGPQEGLIKLSLLKKVMKANPKFTARIFKGKSVTKGTKYKPTKYKKFK
jgi:ribokinase